jgi:hypothetical protein
MKNTKKTQGILTGLIFSFFMKVADVRAVNFSNRAAIVPPDFSKKISGKTTVKNKIAVPVKKLKKHHKKKIQKEVVPVVSLISEQDMQHIYNLIASTSVSAVLTQVEPPMVENPTIESAIIKIVEKILVEEPKKINQIDSSEKKFDVWQEKRRVENSEKLVGGSNNSSNAESVKRVFVEPSVEKSITRKMSTQNRKRLTLFFAILLIIVGAIGVNVPLLFRKCYYLGVFIRLCGFY